MQSVWQFDNTDWINIYFNIDKQIWVIYFFNLKVPYPLDSKGFIYLF